MLDLSPPPAFAEIHGLYVESLRLIVEASDDIAVGMDTSDEARLSQAGPKIEQANALIDQATVLIEDLGRHGAGDGSLKGGGSS